MTFETVSYETNGPVARVTLNRPEVYNAFDKTLRAELSAVFDLVEAAEGIRVCILKGAGKGFSAGGDITDFGYDPISDLIVGEFLPLFEKVDKGNVIYIAQIHGSCAGIAAALAMTCDFITMAEDSALYMAFAAIALAPDGGNTFHLMNAMATAGRWRRSSRAATSRRPNARRWGSRTGCIRHRNWKQKQWLGRPASPPRRPWRRRRPRGFCAAWLGELGARR